MGLDRSKHFGESLPGSAKSGHKYVQDGKFFDVNGEEVTEDGRPVAAKQSANIKQAKAAPAVADEVDPEVAAQSKV